MAKKNDDQNLFDLDLETQDIVLPGEDMTLRIPTQTQSKQAASVENKTVDDPPSLRDSMLKGAEMPPLMAVDIAPGEIPQADTVVSIPATKPAKTETIQTTDTPPAEKNKEIKPAAQEIVSPATTTKEKTSPATQGQQGEPGKGTKSEEELSPTYLHAAALHETGVLPNLDLEALKELESGAIVDKLLETSREEVDNQVKTLNEQYKNQFNDDQKKVMDMFEEGVQFDDAANTVYNQLKYDSLDETKIKESPETQEQLYREFLYAKGHNDTYINRAIKQSKDLERMEEDGISSHKELTQMVKDDEVAVREEAKTERDKRKKLNDDNIKRIKADVTTTTEILKGVPITKADQDKILQYMTTPAAEIVRNGQRVSISKMEEIRRNNPLEFNKRMAYFVHLGLFGDNPALDLVEKAGETNAVNKLKDVLAGGVSPQGGRPAISDKDTKNIQGKETEREFRLPKSIVSVRHD